MLKPEVQVNSSLNNDRKGWNFDIYIVIFKEFEGQSQWHDPAGPQCSTTTKQL